MLIRGLISCAVCAVFLTWSCTTHGQTVSNEIDDDLRSLRIARETLSKNEPLQTALTDALRCYRAGDGDGLWRAMQLVHDADAALPDVDTLLARLLGANDDAPQGGLRFNQLDEAPLLQDYESASNRIYLESRNELDVDKNRTHLQDALTYSRALVKLKPDDLNYRFNVGYLQQELGEREAARAIMDELAPRDKNGFAKAHLWHADHLLAPDRPLTPETLDAAEAHLRRALASYPEPEEVHRRLGELYYFRYVRYNPRVIDPAIPAREVYLERADEHLSKITTADAKLALTRAEIRALRGRTKEAEDDMRAVIADLNKQLRDVPDDVEKRIRLAQAHRMVREFDKAVEVLEVGRRLRPDERLGNELGAVHHFQALDLKQRVPNSLSAQFAALRKAYLAFPTNNYVAYRFVQALSSTDDEEAEIARTTLQELVDDEAPGQMAPLLLGFDYTRRNLPTKSDAYLGLVRSAKPDKTPEVIAGLATAVLNGQVKSLKPTDAHQLFEMCRRVWPDDPDLLMVQAQQNLMLRDYAKALADLNKALEHRPNDVKINEMLAETYERIGQHDAARKHREAAEVNRTHSAAPEP